MVSHHLLPNHYRERERPAGYGTNQLMKQLPFPYHLVRPPKAVRRARAFGNVVLVPASLLPRKGKYQKIANNLPKGGVLICQTNKKQRISHVLAQVASCLRENGHFVRTLPYSLI
jgi:hypothetical protein